MRICFWFLKTNRTNCFDLFLLYAWFSTIYKIGIIKTQKQIRHNCFDLFSKSVRNSKTNTLELFSN